MSSYLKKITRRRRRPDATKSGPNHKHPVLLEEKNTETDDQDPFVPLSSIHVNQLSALVSPLKSPYVIHKSAAPTPSLVATIVEGSSTATSTNLSTGTSSSEIDTEDNIGTEELSDFETIRPLNSEGKEKADTKLRKRQTKEEKQHVNLVANQVTITLPALNLPHDTE